MSTTWVWRVARANTKPPCSPTLTPFGCLFTPLSPRGPAPQTSGHRQIRIRSGTSPDRPGLNTCHPIPGDPNRPVPGSTRVHCSVAPRRLRAWSMPRGPGSIKDPHPAPAIPFHRCRRDEGSRDHWPASRRPSHWRRAPGRDNCRHRCCACHRCNRPTHRAAA